MKAIAILTLLLVVILSLSNYSYAHQLFNSNEYRIAGYIIQIATQPEIPAVDTVAKILIRVADSNGNDMRDVNVGVKLYKNDVLYYTHPITLLKDGHLEIDYIFKEPGIYIVEVSLYEHDGNVVTANFNIGIVKEFAYIFGSMIILGVTMPAVIVAGIILYKRRIRAASR
jgi:hypothetical protein